MDYISTENGIIVKNILNFNISLTFDCGQCFRWNKNIDNSFTGVAFNKKLLVFKKDDELIIKGITLKEFDNTFKEYFDLETDYSYIVEKLSNINDNMKTICDYGKGIRILKQDPWEALCSFIISQNNNIPRIKGIISKMCMLFGEKINDNTYSFPTANKISTLDVNDLSEIKSGFRAKYIIDAARKVSSGEVDLLKVKDIPIDLAREELLKINGVGPKVAECVLLYGMHRLESFPVDVWMKRAIETLFNGNIPKAFGEYAGIAQQYIFHYSRMHPEIFK